MTIGSGSNPTGTWDGFHHTASSVPRTYPRQGSAALLPLQPDSSPPYRVKVLVTGGAGALWASPTTPATASVEQLDLGVSGPLLLPDARVMVAGKDGLFNASPYHYPEKRVEIYSPPYLFAGTRPSITSAPATLGYGQSFSVGVGTVLPTAVGRVALLRMGSTTHGVNMDQRYVGLTISARGGATLTLTSPPNGAVAPPGHYMLFLVSNTGVPSVAAVLKLQ